MRACKLGRGGLVKVKWYKIFDYDRGDMSLVLMKTVFYLV